MRGRPLYGQARDPPWDGYRSGLAADGVVGPATMRALAGNQPHVVSPGGA